MNHKHRETIDSCLEDITKKTDLERLWPKLLENKIFNRDDVNVPRWKGELKKEDTVRDVYRTIKTRGPSAFERLIVSLRQTGHENVADALENKKPIARSGAAELPTSNGNTLDDSNGDAPSERDQDNYFITLQSTEEPLKIVVKKATEFLDDPVFEKIQRYPMRSNPRGLVLIVTNINYLYADEPPRYSAERDEDNLVQLFDQMGFSIVKFRDLTGKELVDRIKEFSQREDWRRVDSCFVVIGGHGGWNEEMGDTEIKGIDYTKGRNPNYKSILCEDVENYFVAKNCSLLAGKPKVFIYQLCRGNERQRSVKEPRHTTDTSNFRNTESEEINNLRTNITKTTRNKSDMLIAQATMPRQVAFRDKFTGSWFIQILCEVFMNYACSTHLQDLFTMIDGRLEIQRTTREECQTSMVTSKGFNKHCYLNPGLFEET